ncbi:uroporphyrinogen-III synthase [Roseovarius sp. MBR-6]|uniref:uroporphyrinogen-III synthase n=1 Tax=Roseovarius sp. MBR-6 TaxID=3156459 RepID=UPI003392B21C
MPTLLITRPEPEASRMAERLRARWPGVGMVVSPLMRIAYRGELPAMTGRETLIFTSRNGVEGFCRLTPGRNLRAYAVGEATAETARARGFEAIAAEGDAASLLALIAREGARGPFLHPRGEHVAADIAGALRAQGSEAADVVVYAQEARPLSPEARSVLDGDAPVILPLMSPRNGLLFFADAGTIRAPLLVAAMSRNVADTVPEGAATRLIVAKTPDMAALCAALHDLVSHAKRVEGRDGAQ